MRIFYLKAEKKVELERECVYLSDVASILCEDDRAQREAQRLAVYRFSGEKRAIIDVLHLIELLQNYDPDCAVMNLGESAVLVERHAIKPHPVLEKLKIVLISLLSFFGAAFTIMAFHNDISIEDIFSKVYFLVMGMESNGFTILEISYSVGLSAGIILFFNHIGTRRITKDPAPIEVQMRQYESDVVEALVENASREQAHGGQESADKGMMDNADGKRIHAEGGEGGEGGEGK